MNEKRSIYRQMLEAQKAINHATKDAKNPHYRNDYATLESVIDAVKAPLNSVGLFVYQILNCDDRGHFVETIVSNESGESISSKCYLVLAKNDMQALGAAQTYARRYSLASMFFITQIDDDANSAVNLAPKPNFNKPQPIATGRAVTGTTNTLPKKEEKHGI